MWDRWIWGEGNWIKGGLARLSIYITDHSTVTVPHVTTCERDKVKGSRSVDLWTGALAASSFVLQFNKLSL